MTGRLGLTTPEPVGQHSTSGGYMATPEVFCAGKPQPCTIDACIRAVEAAFQLTRRQLVGPDRARSVARPRQMAMWLARQATSASLPMIGRSLGFRDHTTILHGCRQIDWLRQSDPSVQRFTDAALSDLTANRG